MKPLVSTQHKVGAESRGKGYGSSNDDTSVSVPDSSAVTFEGAQPELTVPMQITYTRNGRQQRKAETFQLQSKSCPWTQLSVTQVEPLTNPFFIIMYLNSRKTLAVYYN